jgi:hypothetical protein
LDETELLGEIHLTKCRRYVTHSFQGNVVRLL